MLKVVCAGKSRDFEPVSGITAAEFLREHGYSVPAPCGGNGKCGKCRIHAHGGLSEITAEEKAFLSEEDIRGGVRLACLCRLTGEDAVLEPGSNGETMGVTDGELPDMELSPFGDGLGLAVDIGTTTVAAYLYDLSTGMRLGRRARENAQTAFGADVVARLSYSLAGDGEKLKTAITEEISGMAEQLCAEAGRSVGEIGAAVITGNTAMLYFINGYPVDDIAAAPFEARHLFGGFEPAEKFFAGWRSGARVYFPPCIGAYLGADLVCAMLASAIEEKTEPTLLADIGTNGEMALISNGELFCCSTAAGPAFEGAGISHGTGARPGAIDKVSAENGELVIHVIGDEKAASICGSGLLDAAAAALELELIDEAGHIEEDIVLSEEVCLTQADVRALQLAKAAIRAGMDTLTERGCPGKTPVLMLAGGFGTKLFPVSAERIGLIPPDTAEGCVPLGNAAGVGASMMLLSENMRRRGEEIAARSKAIELTGDPVFSERYIENMFFE